MKRGWLKAILRWSTRVLLVLVVLFVIFIAEESIRGRIALARYKAELRAKGEKLTLAELNLPKPSLGTNGAAALLAAVDELDEVSKTNPPHNFSPIMRFIVPGRVQVFHRQEDVVDWNKLHMRLAAVSNALNRARVAVQQPTLTVELDYARELRPQLSHLGKMHHLGPWFAAAALEALHRGDLDSALENVVTIAKLARLEKDVRILGIQQSRVWVARTGLRVTWEALQADGWTEQRLARLQKCWQEAECLPNYVPSIEADQFEYLWSYSRDTLKGFLHSVRSSYSPESLQLDWDDLIGYACSRLGFKSYEVLQQHVEYVVQCRLDNAELISHWLVWRAAWFEQDQLRTLRKWQENLEGTRAVVKDKSWAAWSVKPERRWTIYDSWRYFLCGAYGLDRQIQDAAQYETLREMTVAAIALKRCQLRTGKLPASLSALVPEFLPELPHDWMDGKPLRYRLNADGTFTLYSVGNDGVDNGGDPNPQPPTTRFGLWLGRDELWPAPATREDIEAWNLRWLQRKQPAGRSQR